MESGFRKLFSRNRSSLSRRGNLPIQGQSYSSAVASTAPDESTYHVAGHGPRPVIRPRERQYPERPSIELVAAAPDIPRRRHSDAGRPQTAPQGNLGTNQLEPYERPRSRFSTKAPSLQHRKNNRERSVSAVSTTHSISAFASDTESSHERTPYIDILDAVWPINPSREIYVQRTRASGRRHYGEDVADRNIAEFGAVDISTSQYGHHKYQHGAHSQDILTKTAGLRTGGDVEERVGFVVGRASRVDSDGAGDDTISRQHQVAQHNSDSTHLHAIQDPVDHAIPTYSSTPTGSGLGNADLETNDIPKTSQSTKSFSAFADSSPTVITSSNSTSMTSPWVDAQSRDPEDLSTPGGSGSTRNRRKPKSEQTLLAKKSGGSLEDISGTLAQHQGFQTKRPEDVYGPASIVPTSRFRPKIPLLTPPMSPGTNNNSIPRSSLDKELPSTPGSHSRGQSVNYSSPRGSYESVPAAIIGPRTSSPTAQHNLKKRPGRVFDESGKVVASIPGLKDVIDPTVTTDTEVITHTLPAVIHEHVTPKVHHIKEERITREVHNHDVFHRIQPIIDIEALPTKHYIPSPSGNGLVEIPATAVPGRHLNWETRPVEANGVNSSGEARPTELSKLKNYASMIQNRQPTVFKGPTTMTSDGVERQETIWRHPPELENGAKETGQSVPLHIYHDDSDGVDEYSGYSERQSTNAGNEEALLFKDSEQAFGGRLPGLKEWNPAVSGTGSIPQAEPGSGPRRLEIEEGEATKALKRRQAEVNRRMEMLSVKE